MIYPYGNAKTGGAGANDWTWGTDLGIQTDFAPNTQRIGREAAQGRVATISTIVPGTGYKLGEKINLVQTATSGNGSGFTASTTAVEAAGILNIGSELQPTAGFNNYQNTLLENLNIAASQYTYARTTATGEPFSGVSLAAMPGVSATGTAGTFTVTVNYGVVTKIVVGNLGGLGGGTLYKVGDVVTIDKATLELNGSFGGGIVFQGDLQFLVTEDNVTGGLGQVEILNDGIGYAGADTITLAEEGSPEAGTGTVTVATLSTASTIVTAPNNRYPRAVRCAEGSITTPKTIEFVGMDDVNVIIGGFVTGQIFPFNFKQIIEAGSDVTLGETTILY